MSVLTRSIRWFILSAAVIVGSSVSAESFHPFAEPMEFDPDWQWFAPIQLQDVEELSPLKRANHGWFATFDRMRIALSRPDTAAANTTADWGWGNRFDFGMTNFEDKGWLFSYWHIAGPNKYDEVLQYRLNLFNANDTENYLQPLFPSFFRNDPETNERTYNIKQSVNVADIKSIEANRFWRKEPYRYGGILEPMLGMRYMNFLDSVENDTYFFLPDPTDINTATSEVLIQQIRNTSNQMVLGQIGYHYLKYSQRWTFTNDMKLLVGQNFQSQQAKTLQTTTVVAPGLGNDPTYEDKVTGTSFSGSDNSEFVIGFDLRAEVAYQISKYVDLRTGFMMLYLGRGVWRGANDFNGSNSLHNQDIIMPGWTFGVTVNR